MSSPLKVAICGSGNRSRTVWQRHVNEMQEFALVGVHDVAQESLDKAVELGGLTPERSFTDLQEMLERTEPDVLIACPVHSAHAWAVECGLNADAHVLVEKPFTTDVADAARVAKLADDKGLQLGVVQNWRPKSVGRALKRAVDDGLVGDVSHIFFRYLRDREKPHLPEYLFDEPDPMLFAVAIHHFDLFRYILGQEVVRVSGHAATPRWSRYRHHSIMQLWMETDGGVVVSYASTFSSRNGGRLAEESYQVEGELGTLHSETNYSDPPLLFIRRDQQEPIDLTSDAPVRDSAGQYALADRAILENFHAAVTRSEPLLSPAWDNIRSLAVVEAARRCLADGRPVDVAECLPSGYALG